MSIARDNRCRILAALGLACASAVAGGCIAAAAVPVIAAGAVAGEKGYAFWDSGTLKYVDEASFEEMSSAVDATNERLALVTEDRIDVPRKKGEQGAAIKRRVWTLSSDNGRVLEVTIAPITERMVSVSVESGLLGSRPAARMYADRLKAELEERRMPVDSRS
ncbi:MAG: hypothetical protein AAFX79_01765 [Planctomycetota bacterium]